MPATQTPQRLQLGRELRRWRQAAEMEAKAVAQELVCPPSKISKIENGQGVVSPLELQILLRLYSVPEGEPTERIMTLHAAARQRAQYRVAQWVRTYMSLEAEAVEIRYFHIDLMPGLFQTAEYAHAVTAAYEPSWPAAEVARLVGIRQQRQDRLTGKNAAIVLAVIHESAIRTWVGGVDVMRGQLQRLRELSDLPNVTIRVLPFRAGEHRALGSAFTILRLDGSDDPQVVYLEDLWNADYVNRPDQITAYNEVFNSVLEMSLDEKGTEKAITEAMGELR